MTSVEYGVGRETLEQLLRDEQLDCALAGVGIKALNLLGFDTTERQKKLERRMNLVRPYLKKRLQHAAIESTVEIPIDPDEIVTVETDPST